MMRRERVQHKRTACRKDAEMLRESAVKGCLLDEKSGWKRARSLTELLHGMCHASMATIFSNSSF